VARERVEARGSEPDGGNRRCRAAWLERGHKESARVWQMRARGWSNACAAEQSSAQLSHGKAEASA
jgi:hypothetical protein